MTENKRFYMDKSGDLYDKENENGSVMIDFGYSYDGVGCKKIVDLLNKLNDENQHIRKLVNENKQLKIRFKEERERALKFGRNIDTLTVKNEQLKKENKELKKENKLLKDTLSSIVFDGKNVEIMTNGDVE